MAGININRERLIRQLKDDEGFIASAKWDNKQYSYGYGCRAPRHGATITEPEAAKLLERRMDEAIEDFARIFQDHLYKFNDVRAECLINMVFNMGPGRAGDPGAGGFQSFVNTLSLIYKHKVPDWGAVARGFEKSLWYRQVGNSGDPDGPGPKEGRGERIVRQIKTGQY